jgi:RND family efflux transporter MFP subunit
MPLFEYTMSDQAELEQAEAEVDRLEKLLAMVGSKPQLSQKVESELRFELTGTLTQARARRDRAKIHQTAHQIKSPNRGKILLYNTSTQKTRGVTEGLVVATITPTDSILVDYYIDQGAFLKLRRQQMATGKKSALDIGAPIDVWVAGDSGVYQGHNVTVEQTFDPKTHKLHCRASMPNPDGLFIPGMSATVEIATSAPRKALWLPSEAEFMEHIGVFDGSKLMLVVNGQDSIEARLVTLTRRYAGKYEVKDGLKEGDWVVVSGRKIVKEGRKIVKEGMKVKR